LDFAQLAAGQHLYVRTDLFSRPCLAGAQFNVPGDQFVATCNREKTTPSVFAVQTAARKRSREDS